MSEIIRAHIEQPHPDIEHQVTRDPLEYVLTFPDQGLQPDTGLIFVINGFGMTPDAAYNVILSRYLASRYNCLTVGVLHFGLKMKSNLYGALIPAPDFFDNLSTAYGLSISAEGLPPAEIVKKLCRRLHINGIMELPANCLLFRDCGTEYESFGLLPALDHLQVLGNLLQRYPIDRRRIFSFGTSMGGYIALLLAKLAPHTFRMAIDNSGFVQSNDLSDPQTRFAKGKLMGVRVRVLENSAWSGDPQSPHFFGPHHRMIRDLGHVPHMTATTTLRCLYHSVDDALVPITDKDRYVARAAAFGPLSYHRIDAQSLDGRRFKDLEHGMGASLRHLFDHAWSVFTAQPHLPDNQGLTDFCRASDYSFACDNRAYRLRFGSDGSIAASLNFVRVPRPRLSAGPTADAPANGCHNPH